MMDTEYDVSRLLLYEDDFLTSFIDLLLAQGYEERYIESDFDGDDVFLSATINGDLFCEIGMVNDQTYVSVIDYKLQYYIEGKELNIIEEFKSLYKEFIDG